MLASDAGKHGLAEFRLAHMEGRGGDIQHHLPTGSNQIVDRIAVIQTAAPECLVVPCIFADRERDGLAANANRPLHRSRHKRAHLVKYIVGGQQALGLNEVDSAVPQQRGGVHHRLSRLRSGRRRETGDDGKIRKLGCEFLQHLPRARDESRNFDKIARRISAHR